MLTLRELGSRLALGTATPDDFEGFAPQDVIAVKRDLPNTVRSTANAASPILIKSGPKPKKKAEADDEEPQKSEVRAALEDGKPMVRTYAATVQVVDRLGDLVMTRANLKGDGDSAGEGFRTENFINTGGVFLWSHMASSPGIGQVSKPRQTRILAPDGNRYWATVEDVRYIVDDRIPFSVPAAILVDEGVALAVSVGFVGVKVWYPDDEKVRTRMGLGRYGVVFVTSEQTELSQAQTPAHQFALAEKKDAGYTERRAHEALERAVETGELPASLRDDFIRVCAVGPKDEAMRLRASTHGFVDLAANLRDVEPEIVRGRLREITVATGGVVAVERETSMAGTAETPSDEIVVPLGRGVEVGTPVAEGVEFVRGGDATLPEMRHAFARDAALYQISKVLGFESMPELDELDELVERAARLAKEGPVGSDASGGFTARHLETLESAFEAFSRGTEILANLQDELDGLPTEKGLDSEPAEKEDSGGITPLVRSIESLVGLIKARELGGEDSTSGGPGMRGDETERGACAGESDEIRIERASPLAVPTASSLRDLGLHLSQHNEGPDSNPGPGPERRGASPRAS